MSNTPSVERDERTVAVENASYKWAYIFLGYALLIDVMYRGIFRHEAAWDLIALLIVAAAIFEVYQVRRKAHSLSRRWVMERVIIVCGGAAVIGFIVAAIMVWLRS